LQRGIIKFGMAIKIPNSSEYSYYCSDRKVWEETGYFNEKPIMNYREKIILAESIMKVISKLQEKN
jgi:hypothetical protein